MSAPGETPAAKTGSPDSGFTSGERALARAPAGGASPSPPFLERVKALGLVLRAPAAEGDPHEIVVRIDLPVAGGLAVIFGVAGLFQSTWLLAPLAVLAGVLAIFRGQNGLGLVGLFCGLAGALSSASLWTLVGLGWLWSKIF